MNFFKSIEKDVLDLSSVTDYNSFRRAIQQMLYDGMQARNASWTIPIEEAATDVLHEFGILTDSDVHSFIRDHVLDANQNLNQAVATGIKRTGKKIPDYFKAKKKTKSVRDPSPLPREDNTDEKMDIESDDDHSDMWTSASTDRCCVDLGTISLKGNHDLRKKIGDSKRVFNLSWTDSKVFSSLANGATWVWASEYLTAQTLATSATSYTYNTNDYGDGFNSISLLEMLKLKGISNANATATTGIGNQIDNSISENVVIDTQYKEYHFKNISQPDNETPIFVDVYFLQLQKDLPGLDFDISAGNATDLVANPGLTELLRCFTEFQRVSTANQAISFNTAVSDAAAAPPITLTSQWWCTLGDAAISGAFKVKAHKRFCLARGQQGTLVVKLPKSQFLTFDYQNRGQFVSIDTTVPAISQKLPLAHQKGSIHMVYRFQGGIHYSHDAGPVNSTATIEPSTLSLLTRHKVIGRSLERTNVDNVYSYNLDTARKTIDADVDLDYAV